MVALNLLLSALFGTAVLAAPAAVDQHNAALAQRDLNTNKFIDEILKYIPGSMLVNEACDLIGDGEKILSNVFGFHYDSNSNGCTDVTLIFARGTCDPGNVGVLVGPPFFQALATALGPKSLNVQGVAYPASVDGYLNADTAAGETMAQIVRDTRSGCPNTKIVLSGYSQGGMAVHDAAKALGGDMSNVSAVVIFGDPYSHEAVANIDPGKVLVTCHDGDDICNQGAVIMPQHLTYAVDAASSADFVASHC